jgi:hypothetical protein
MSAGLRPADSLNHFSTDSGIAFDSTGSATALAAEHALFWRVLFGALQVGRPIARPLDVWGEESNKIAEMQAAQDKEDGKRARGNARSSQEATRADHRNEE